VGGELDGWILGGGRRDGIRGGEFMEMDLRVLEVGCVIETVFGLAEEGGGGGVENWDVVGGDEAGELEELVEMALHWKWYHYYHHFSLFGDASEVMAWIFSINIHDCCCGQQCVRVRSLKDR